MPDQPKTTRKKSAPKSTPKSTRKPAKKPTAKPTANPVKKPTVYRPDVFSVRSIDEAKRIILTPEPGASTEERWVKETPYLVDELVRTLAPDQNSIVMDYGCGIGRLAKELIARTGCMVLGVDISLEMRVLANSYVSSDRFTVTSREGLLAMIRHGLRVDHAYSVWVLQHCPRPAEDVALLHAGLRPGGRCYIANGHTSCVPTDKGWMNDGTDIAALLEPRFELLEDKPLPEGIVSDTLRRFSFCRLFAARAPAPAGG